MQCWHLDGKKIDRSFDTPKDDHLVANPRLVRQNKANFFSQKKQSRQRVRLSAGETRNLSDQSIARSPQTIVRSPQPSMRVGGGILVATPLSRT